MQPWRTASVASLKPAPKRRPPPRARLLLYGRNPMIDQDFFAYCTSLRLLELKAIGELSRVRHLGEGETIYSTGDAGDCLYIINRGVVEVIQPSTQNSAPAGYLSRG